MLPLTCLHDQRLDIRIVLYHLRLHNVIVKHVLHNFDICSHEDRNVRVFERLQLEEDVLPFSLHTCENVLKPVLLLCLVDVLLEQFQVVFIVNRKHQHFSELEILEVFVAGASDQLNLLPVAVFKRFAAQHIDHRLQFVDLLKFLAHEVEDICGG